VREGNDRDLRRDGKMGIIGGREEKDGNLMREGEKLW